MTRPTFTSNSTVGSIVAYDMRTAPVFTLHGIDFCCKGSRTVEEACRARNLAPDVLLCEINEALSRSGRPGVDHASWSLTQLIEHIEQAHHAYVNEHLPIIQQYLHKLRHVHGALHPELHAIAEEFDGCTGALTAHMKKEELVLFPYIEQLENAQATGTFPGTPHFGTVGNPVRLMEAEHDAEGERFRWIAELSHGYAVPADGCATYAAAMRLLKDFEEDLHLHIHLENNILFPRALRMEQEMRG
ncbi:MAG: iron-sulfur cluster repair di-iron protein [Flavobacteriales bacterium]|nr:iron-sulfur cluster repair di-iron protein [Flavobacteriales bacterium]